MGSEEIESLKDDELELDELEDVDADEAAEDGGREDSALEDLKAVQAAIAASDDDDDDDDLGGMSLGFGAQAAASLSAGASLGGPSPAGPSPAPSASLGAAPAADATAEAGASLSGKSAVPASLAGAPAAAAPVAATAQSQPQQGKTQWGIIVAIAAVALATVGAVAYVAINPQVGTSTPEEDVGVGRAALAGGAMAAGAANPSSQLQKAARPLGAAPEAQPIADASKVADNAGQAALDELNGDENGLILDDADGEFEEGDPMHGGAKLERKKKKKVEIEYGLQRNKRDDGDEATDAAPEPEPEEAVEPEPETPVDGEDEPKTPKSEENIDCLLNPGAPGCKKYDMPKAETQKEQLPDKLSQRDIAMGLRQPKKDAKQCGKTHSSSEVVRVHVTIGGDGTVQKVTAKGLHKGTPLGTCVEGFLSKATFPQFQKQSMGLDISVAM